VKLLLDENLSPSHARDLRSLGHDAVSVVELGLAGADDSEVRAAAISDNRVLVTLDADFSNILRHPPAPTPGVIRLRLHPATESAIAVALSWAIPKLEQVALSGKLAVVAESRIRIRG
jgi:predicted nuclease of predicted toxin-antitoxin system